MFAGVQNPVPVRRTIAALMVELPRRPGTTGANGAIQIPIHASRRERQITMLYTIAVVLVILWLLGLVTAYTMGGLIHVLLVIAIVVVLLRVISGRAPL
jgi:hypothetical protein